MAVRPAATSGLVSIVAARIGMEVTATDLEGNLPLLRENCNGGAAERHWFSPPCRSFSCMFLRVWLPASPGHLRSFPSIPVRLFRSIHSGPFIPVAHSGPFVPGRSGRSRSSLLFLYRPLLGTVLAAARHTSGRCSSHHSPVLLLPLMPALQALYIPSALMQSVSPQHSSARATVTPHSLQ